MKLVIATVLALTATTAFADAAQPRSIYRIDVSITGIQDNPGAAAAPATYTLFLEDNEPGKLSTGTNIPLNATSRQETGLSMDFRYSVRGATVVLEGEIELTTPTGSAVIHRIRARGVAAITPGTPTLFTSLYDITSHHRYEVNISAQHVL